MGEAVDGSVAASSKRSRGESGESPEWKRFRAADFTLLDILEDAADSADRSVSAPASGDLAVVLRSFEEEIAAVLSPHPSQEPQQQVEDEVPQPALSTSVPDRLRPTDLDYLLEASDDELGLPPPSPPPCEREVTEDGIGMEAPEGVFGQIWGLDDEIPNYFETVLFGGLGRTDDRSAAADTDDVAFDGGLFEYPGAPDFAADCLWRPESLSAV